MKRYYITLTVGMLAWTTLLFALPYQAYKQGECWWCHKTKVRLVVHHIEPQHLRPDLANDHPKNYVTFCDPVLIRSSGCHYKLGHRGINWKYDNSDMLKVIIEHERKENKNNQSEVHN